jgi:hypothetical protein
MKSYLCANRHHFRNGSPECPVPDCTAEVRPTTVSPLDGPAPDFEKLKVEHEIQWWEYEDGNWDVTCACGWASNTGGSTPEGVDRLANAHKEGLL